MVGLNTQPMFMLEVSCGRGLKVWVCVLLPNQPAWYVARRFGVAAPQMIAFVSSRAAARSMLTLCRSEAPLDYERQHLIDAKIAADEISSREFECFGHQRDRRIGI